ncbi:hypothetical protein DPMN_193099, partial [Dreissena polymorpha]
MESPRILPRHQQTAKSVAGDLPTSVEEIKLCWKKFDGAGLNFLEQTCKQLTGNKFEKVAKDVIGLLGPVFQFAESEQVLGRLREIEKRIRQSEKSATQQTEGLHCLLLFIKLQTDYHQMCSTLLSTAIEHLHSMCREETNLELANQLKTLDLSAANYAKAKKPSTSGRSSPRTTKPGLKASIFSFFERKNVAEEGGNSSFYVDIDDVTDLNDGGTNCDTDVLEEKDSYATSGERFVVEQSKPEMLIDFGTEPGPDLKEDSELCQKSDGSVLTALTTREDGHVASREELDSVIRFLSGGSESPYGDTVLVDSMSSTHLNSNSYGKSHGDLCDMDKSSKSKMEGGQPRSEGSINTGGFMADWHGNGATLPVRHTYNTPHLSCDYTTPPPPYFSGNQYRPNTLPPGGAGHFQGAYSMGFPDPSLNRAWPINNLAVSGSVMNTISGSWSGGHDSDEASDDSSVGGDHLQQRNYLQDLRSSKTERADSLQYSCNNHLGLMNQHSYEDLL